MSGFGKFFYNNGNVDVGNYENNRRKGNFSCYDKKNNITNEILY
jgi:hypothetical protein